MGKQKRYKKEFKEDAVMYRKEHQEMTMETCARNLGISPSALRRWVKAADENGNVVMRGSGNYASDEAKEIAHLKKELKDTKDALEILKKAMGILSK